MSALPTLLPDPLIGLPDFGAPIAVAGQATSLFAPYLAGSYRVPPQGLTVGTNSDGTPQMSLVLVNSQGDLSAAGQYAVFDFMLVGDFALDPALVAARALDANATVAPIVIDSGYTRLFPTNNEVALSPDLLTPVEIGGSGLGYARWTARLSATAGALVKGALADSTALLGAQVEYQAAGVAPRMPGTATFQPATLIAALIAASPAGSSNRLINAGDLAAAIQQAIKQQLITLQQSTTADPYQAIADRIATSFCSFVPALQATDPPCLQFADPATLSNDAITWDLSQPTRVLRQASIVLDQLGGLSAALLSSIVREVTVPAIPLGQWSVDITTNLPAHRAPGSQIGVSVQLAANPPFRPSSIDHQFPFIEPDDRATCQLHLSPREALSYTAVPFAVIATATGGVYNFTGATSQHTDNWVRLSTADFPVSYAHVSISPQLAALSNVTLTFSYTLVSGPVQQQAVLNTQALDIAFPFPNISTGGSVQVVATPIGGSNALILPPCAPGRIALDLTSFREYGPHRIDISVDQAPTDPLVIELIPETQVNNASITPSVVFFTAGQLTGTWGYFAASPFQCGYCFRVASTATTPTPTRPWSAVQPPFQPLALHVDGSLLSNLNPAAPLQPELVTAT